MGTYSLEQPLPSCKVPRALLEELEDYLKTLEQLVPLSEEAMERTVEYRFVVKDTIGTEVLQSVQAFDRATFPNDTKAILFRYSAKSARRLVVEIAFFEDGSNQLRGSFNGNSSREVSMGLNREILSRIEPYKTMNFLFHSALFKVFNSTLFAAGAVFCVTPLLAKLFGFQMSPAVTLFSNSRQSLVGGISLFFVASFMRWLQFAKPHTTFDTAKNTKQEKTVTFILLGFVGFILFTVIGVYLRLKLFGF
jgi:hypothetical protein